MYCLVSAVLSLSNSALLWWKVELKFAVKSAHVTVVLPSCYVLNNGRLLSYISPLFTLYKVPHSVLIALCTHCLPC